MERRAGFIDVLENNNMNIEFELKIPEKDEILEITKKTIGLNKDFFLNKELDGVFASADIIASYLIHFLSDIGIRVPQDISIIGFDNSFFSELTIPRITSISLNADKCGYLAADNLINKIEKGKYKVRNIVLDPVLYEKESVLDRAL
ncbi:MAG: substrate-binding domain-containing protein [Candidatus Humimicrobiaceae bacterium]